MTRARRPATTLPPGWLDLALRIDAALSSAGKLEQQLLHARGVVRNLDLDRARNGDLEWASRLARDLSRDLEFDLTRVLSRDLARARALSRDLDLNRARALSRDLDRGAHYVDLILAIDRDRNRVLERALDRDLGRVLNLKRSLEGFSQTVAEQIGGFGGKHTSESESVAVVRLASVAARVNAVTTRVLSPRARALYGDELLDELYVLADDGASRRHQVGAALRQLAQAGQLRRAARAERTSVSATSPE
jgi:hypothetical protein